MVIDTFTHQRIDVDAIPVMVSVTAPFVLSAVKVADGVNPEDPETLPQDPPTVIVPALFIAYPPYPK